MNKIWYTALCLLFTPTLHAATALWDISKGGNHIYLGASISVLQQKHYPLPAEFDHAFKRANKLYVERDMDAVGTPEFGTQVMQNMMYSDGRNLKTELSADTYQRLDTFAQSRGVPVFGLAMFKPAFTVVTLSAAESASKDFVYGVDTYYFYKAKETQKPVGTLESAAQQLQLLQKLNDENPDQLIKSTITELGSLTRTVNQAEPLWRLGNVAALDPLFAGKMRSVTPRMYQAMVVQRHQNWLPIFAKLIQSAETEMVLVDVVHVTGADSLLGLLKKNGYKVTPYVKVP